MLPGLTATDLLWSPCNTGPVVKKNQVVTIHDIAVLDHPEWFSPRFSKIYQWLLPRLAEHASHILTVSEFSKARICNALKVSQNKVSVVANGVGEEFYRQPETQVTSAKERLGITTRRYVLTVGSREPRKNLSSLLCAWKTVAAEISDISLVVVGGRGKQFGREPDPPAQDNVILLGYTADSELPALYSGAECVVYPSLYEGFGLPALEALACGTPVITSAGTAMEELAGPSTILVDSRSVDELKCSILRLLNAPCSSAANLLNAKFYQSKYKWESSAAQVSNLFLPHA